MMVPTWPRDERLDPARAMNETLARIEMLYEEETSRRRIAEALAEAREHVLGVVAHDLRSPLNVVVMTAQLLLDLPMEPLQQRQHLRAICRAGEQMNLLIADLLDSVALRAGRLAISTERVRVDVILHEAEESFRSIAGANGIDLKCCLPRDALAVYADPLRVSQIIGNLLANALKFTQRNGQVSLNAALDKEQVRFEVADTGPGIPESLIDRLFDRFWQAQTDRRGIGLGLPIAKLLVEAHGGRLWVRSTVGCGSCFLFTLPAAPPLA
jgi:signal transduction histidine kinase